MKKMLNTIYVTTEGAALRKDGENLVAEVENIERSRVPLHMLSAVVVFGAVFVSPPLMAALASAGIALTFLDRNGRFQARLEGPVSGNVLLRRAQYRLCDTPEEVARSIVIGKVANQRSVLMRSLRDYGEAYEEADRNVIGTVTDRLAHILRRVERADETLDQIRGSEGEAAFLYFSVFDHLIRSPDPEMRWRGRSRRPPLDPVNALLSFLYTLLTHDCRSALESVWLDPAVGFLHRDRPGRPSLALDLMEEMRPVLADRLALSLVNPRPLPARDFVAQDGGAGMMREEAPQSVLTAWQERKREERIHPFLEEKAPLGLVPYLQAQMLARHLRGDLDAYPPWFWK